MPEVCNLYGMSIKLIWKDHLPKHVHVFIGRNETKVTFEGYVLSGKLPPDKLRVLREWLIKRQTELNDNWEKVIRMEPIERIEP